MLATVSKWGNSQGIRLPKEALRSLDIDTGDTISIIVDDDRLIIKPTTKRKQKIDIKELVARMPKDYAPQEEFATKVGVEEW